MNIEKTNKETRSIGMITGNNYGTTHNFSYLFSIPSEDIEWEGGSGEPKNILFCEEQIFIHYLIRKSIREEIPDTAGKVTDYKYHEEIQQAFQKHVDKRYFFNLFGDDYWVNIDSELYHSKSAICNEYEVPNDGELTLTKPVASDK